MMPRSKWLFWIGVALSILLPTLLAIWLIRTGVWLGLPLLLIAVGLFVALRIAFTRRFTADLQPRRPPPPERELIADAHRPTLAIGLGILGITLLIVILVGLFGAGGSPIQRPPTPTPDLSNQTTADTATNPSAPSASLLTGFTLPIAAAVLGTVGLTVLLILTRRTDRVILIPVDDPLPEPEPDPEPDTDPALDWRELLADEDDEDDLSLWVDSLSRDDHPR